MSIRTARVLPGVLLVALTFCPLFSSSRADDYTIEQAKKEMEQLLKDPAKVKIFECMGIKVYEDPQPAGHPPTKEECQQIEKTVGYPLRIPDIPSYCAGFTSEDCTYMRDFIDNNILPDWCEGAVTRSLSARESQICDTMGEEPSGD